jgi:ATP phosphoribosyltransferase
LGLSDALWICGNRNHLRENGLEIVEEIAGISARLIVNIASLKLRKTEIETYYRIKWNSI